MKLLAGSREPLNPSEPSLPAAGAAVPAELGPDAARVWASTVPPLIEAGVMTAVDTTRVARTCRWESIGSRLLDEAEQQTGRKRAELLRLAGQAHTLADRSWQAMGVGDPRERNRMHATPPETDELGAFKRRHA